MRKLVFTAALFLAAFAVKAQTTITDSKRVVARDSFNLDGVWRKTFPGGSTVTGGVVTWVTGLTFAVTAAEYQIKNRVYKSNSGTITLDAAHVSLPRIDVIALNTSGVIVKITGTPAATPAIPQINPATQVYLTAVFVGAGATTPGGVTTTTVYDENIEWTHSEDFPSINFANNTTSYTGSNNILVTGTGASDVSASGGIKFTDGTTHNYSNYDVLRFYIRLNAPWPSTASLQVTAGNGTEPLTVVTNAHGFNPSLIGVYQNVTVPFTAMVKNSNTFDAIYFRVTGNGQIFRLDNIQLQGGVGGGTGPGYVTNVYKKPGTDSVFQVINGVHLFAFIDGGGGGGGGVSSVNGTANRITSTGGANPVLNIPAAFENLFVKNSQNDAVVRIGSNLKIRDTSTGGNFRNEFIWNQTKGAFRANRITSTSVNHIDSIGNFSAAFGVDNKSKGMASVTFGSNNNNNADYSLVSSFVGSYTAPNAEGTNILGYAYDSAFYQNCFITGIGNSAYGTSNTLMGWGLYGRAVNQMVFGVGNDTTGYYQYDPRPVLVSALKPTDALFTFANGMQNVGGPQVVTRSNALQIYRNGTADVYNVWNYKNNINGSFTDLSLITKRYADSALNKKMLDSAFDVIRPTTTGTVSPFDKLSSTQLRISDLKNSATVTWSKDGDGNVIATAAGGGGGSTAIGSTVTGATAGRIALFGTNGLLQQNAALLFDSTAGRLQANTFRGSGIDGDIIIEKGDGTRAFRGVTFTGWTDASAATHFQVGEFSQNIIFAARQSSRINRLMLNAGTTHLTSTTDYSTAPVPTGILQVDDGTNIALRVTDNGTTQIKRSVDFAYIEQTANYTLTDADYTVNCTANSFTITLPTAVGKTGRVYVIKNTGSATTITVNTTSSQTIDGAASQTISTALPLRVQSTGANWIVL